LPPPCRRAPSRPDKTRRNRRGPTGVFGASGVQTEKMAKKMLIDATHAEETRVVVVDGNKVEEFDFESENKRQLAGNIYLAKVTRVEPSLQAAFVDYGGNRHGFLAFSEIHPDYYQIPVADRQALMEEEAALAKAAAEEEDKPKRSRSRTRTRKPTVAKTADGAPASADSAPSEGSAPREPSGMETIDLDDGLESGAPGEGLSPMETVHETPVVEPETAPVEPEIAPVDIAPVDITPVDIAPVEAVPAETGPVEIAPAETADPVAEIPATPEPIAAEPAAAEQAAVDASTAAEPVAPAADEIAAPEADGTALLTPLEASQDAAPTETAQAADAGTDAAPEAAAADAPEEPEDGKPTPRPIAEGTKDEANVVTQDAEAAPAAPATDVAAPDDTAKDAQPDADDHDDEEDDDDDGPDDAASRDDSIESVADDDTHEDIRPARKPRPRRYKIQEVIKVRQIMLVQVVKEERGNKGAALTTYLSLAGRYCVLMPNTARGGGISRKITNAADRSKLKEIANTIDVPKGAGLIIRTAGAKRTKTEIKRDYEYLQRLWEQIRELTLKSIAPAKIYEEGDLIKRSIRDLYSREIDEVLVEGERGYRVAKDFMKMIMPSHAKNVQHYQDQMPLFARFQVESYLGGMFNPTVQLKSGGYIVIGVTEALVAIDVNSGRATKEGSIEDTATKTNLEAAEEVARQLRLRDLAGLIVIDFIDMDERKNNAAVEKRLKDKLKTDRARIQVGRISGFGLLEMSRQRLRPGMIEATTQPCSACHGTGLIRSDDNLALQVLRQVEEEGVRRRSREVLVKCPVGIANYLMNQKREHIIQIETRYGMSVRIEGDPHLVSPDFTLEKFKTATRVVAEIVAPVVSVDTSLMDQVDEAAEVEEEEDEPQEVLETTPEEQPETGEDDKPKKKRRRRRRRSKSKENGDDTEATEADGDAAQQPVTAQSEGTADAAPADEADADKGATLVEVPESSDTAPKKPRSRSRTRKPRSKPVVSEEAPLAGDEAVVPAAPAEGGAPAPASETTAAAAEPETAVAEAAPSEVAAEAAVTPAADQPAVAEPAAEAPTPVAPTPVAPVAELPVAEAVAAEPSVVETPTEAAPVAEAPVAEAAVVETPVVEPAKPKPTRTRRKASDVIAAVAGSPIVADVAPTAEVEAAPDAAKTDTLAEPVAEAADSPEVAEASVEEDDKPKRRGWWSLGS
jgi:ribonuclease E